MQIKLFLSVFIFFSVIKTQAEGQSEFLARVDHAMNRMSYAARPSERAEIIRGGESALQKWINQQFEPDKINDHFVESLLARHESLNSSLEELVLKYSDKPTESTATELKPDEIRKLWSSAKIVRAIFSKRQLQERLVDFWFNHFNVDQRKGKTRWFFGPYERDAIRPYIFGNFKDMLRATARHPAMLFYLDNHLSQKSDPKKPTQSGLNENYGRELLELHTLGVNGGYTQNDVTEAARVLTGWSITDVNKSPIFQFKENKHDTRPKKVMTWEFKENLGVTEGEQLLQNLAAHPATANHISTQLVRAFVADPPPMSLVEKVSAAFKKSNGHLPTVYKALFQSKEFWDPKYRLSLVKDHFTWLISSIRTLNGEVIWKNSLINEFNQLGQPLYQCAPPTGYVARADDIINASTLVQRMNLSLRLASGRIDGIYITGQDKFRAESIDQVITTLSQKVGIEKLSESTHNTLKQEMIGEVWQTADFEVRPFIFSRLLGLILASPDFQRM